MAIPISSQTLAEIQRKAKAGIPLTNPTAQTTALWNQYKTPPPVSANNTVKTGATPNVTYKATGTTGMGATTGITGTTGKTATTGTTGVTAGVTGTTGTVPVPGSHESHQAYIDKTMGGAFSNGTYASNNIDRYNRGEITYDALAKDAARVGYAIPEMKVASTGTSQVTPQVDYNAIASAEQARLLAEKQRIADQQKQGLTAAWNRSNQILQGNRVLEDYQTDAVLNPFSGRTSFAKGITGRERTLADESAQGNYNAAIQGVEQGLADDRNTAAQAIMARAYQLEQDAKNFDLNYAQVYGQGQNGGPTTLAAQNQAFNQSQQQWENRFNYGQATGTFGNGQQTLEAKQANISNLWNVANTTGTIPNELADMYGIPRGTKTLEAKQFGLDQQRIQADIENMRADNARLSSGGSGGSGGSSGGSSSSSKGQIVDMNKPYTTSTMITWIKNHIPGVGNLYGPPPPDMKASIENLILSNPNLSEKQIKELYQTFGIPLPQ